MERLLALLAQAENLSSLDDEALAQLLDDIRDATAEVLDGDVSDDDLATLERAAQVVDEIETEQSNRVENDTQRVARAEAVRSRILGQPEGEEGGEEPAEQVDENGDPIAAAHDPDPNANADPEPVAAGGRVSRIRPRRPDVMNRPATGDRSRMSMVAAANLADIPAGAPLDDPGQLAQAFISGYEQSRGYRGPRVKVNIARIGVLDAAEMYGPERTLRRGAVEDNTVKVDRLFSPAAITASGGSCAPINTTYDMPVIGSQSRPVRDQMLAKVGADRGGIRTLPVPTLDQIVTGDNGAIDTWTAENDIELADPRTKPCLTLTCPEAEETVVDAFTKCLEIGNFRQRFFPEQVQAWIELAAIQHARYAETSLLTTVGAGSTQVTSGQLLGAAVDVLTTLSRALAGFRSRWRLERSTSLRFAAPEWLLDLMRTDIMRRYDGSVDEKLSVADAAIASWITNQNVNMSWFLDGESGQVFGPQGDGPLVGWPSHVVSYLFPEGAWLFLDGGAIDLGLVRDSTLNATNDYQLFAETFEGAHFHGIESYRLTMDLCPDGHVSAPVTIDPCTTGS